MSKITKELLRSKSKQELTTESSNLQSNKAKHRGNLASALRSNLLRRKSSIKTHNPIASAISHND